MIPLRTDQARMESFGHAAIMIETGDRRRVWVVATDAEVDAGEIANDGRTRFARLDEAFDAAHRRALRLRQGRGVLAAAA